MAINLKEASWEERQKHAEKIRLGQEAKKKRLEAIRRTQEAQKEISRKAREERLAKEKKERAEKIKERKHMEQEVMKANYAAAPQRRLERKADYHKRLVAEFRKAKKIPESAEVVYNPETKGFKITEKMLVGPAPEEAKKEEVVS